MTKGAGRELPLLTEKGETHFLQLQAEECVSCNREAVHKTISGWRMGIYNHMLRMNVTEDKYIMQNLLMQAQVTSYENLGSSKFGNRKYRGSHY